MFGVSFDSPADNAAFAQKQGFEFRLLCDTERELGLAFRACESVEDQYPRRITYVIDAKGTIELALETKSPAAQADELLRYLTKSA